MNIDAQDESDDEEDVDWDALNSDELDSEDLDNLEKHGKLLKKKEKPAQNDLKVSTGYTEDIGKKMMKNKEEKKKKN